MLVPFHYSSLFKEGQLWGTVEVTGVVVHSAGYTNLGISTCRGAGPGAPENPFPSPRRVVSFWSGGRSWFLLNREASITSSPLMVINRAMKYWISLMALHRMPCMAADASAQAYSTLAKARVFSCQMIWKFQGSEAEGRKSSGHSPCSVDRASHHLEASCCATGSLNTVIRCSVGQHNHYAPLLQHVSLSSAIHLP